MSFAQNLQCGCCNTDDCEYCFDVVAYCGGQPPSTITVYPSHDGSCTGTPVATGSYDGVHPWCITLPNGRYDIKTVPTDTTSFYASCKTIDIGCTGDRSILLGVNRKQATIRIVIHGCHCGLGGTGCELDAVAVTYTDPYNTASLSAPNATDPFINGLIYDFVIVLPESLDVFPYDAEITVGGFPTGCHFQTVDRTISIGLGDICGRRIDIQLLPESGWVCTTFCACPLPESIEYTDDYVGSVTLNAETTTYDDGMRCADVWSACASSSNGTNHIAYELGQCFDDFGDPSFTRPKLVGTAAPVFIRAVLDSYLLDTCAAFRFVVTKYAGAAQPCDPGTPPVSKLLVSWLGPKYDCSAIPPPFYSYTVTCSAAHVYAAGAVGGGFDYLYGVDFDNYYVCLGVTYNWFTYFAVRSVGASTTIDCDSLGTGSASGTLTDTRFVFGTHDPVDCAEMEGDYALAW